METVTVARLYELLASFEQTAYHFEQQPYYEADLDAVERWRQGDHTTPDAVRLRL
jgi:hypothetical protein